MNEKRWMIDKLMIGLQSYFLMAVICGLAGLMVFFIGGWELTVIALASLTTLYFINPMVSPAILLRLYRAEKLDPFRAPTLHRIVAQLSEQAGLQKTPHLFYVPSRVLNAFTAGSIDNSFIGITEGLLANLSKRDITAVLAHEISHIRHHDIRILGFSALVSNLTHLISVFGQFLLIVNLPLLLIGGFSFSWLTIFLMVFAPALSTFLHLALSRTREFNADLGAAKLMDDPEALAGALTKLQAFRKPKFSSFFWSSYRNSQKNDQVNNWLLTHPPTKERIRRLVEIKEKEPVSHSSYAFPSTRTIEPLRPQRGQYPIWKYNYPSQIKYYIHFR